jgi:hypothetical protein
MRGDISANSIAENVLAEKSLQHSQKRLAFFVCDIVENTVGFGLRCDGLLNRMSSRTRIAFHRRFFGDARTPRRISG